MIRDLAQTGLKGRTITPGTVDIKIPAGMLDAILTILGDPDLVPAKIPHLVDLFGVVGSYDTEAANPIAAAAVLAGKKGRVNGAWVTGTMPDNGATGGTITTQGGTYAIPAGKTTGGVVTANMTGLVASVITYPNVVGGVEGTVTSVTSAGSTLNIAAVGSIAGLSISYPTVPTMVKHREFLMQLSGSARFVYTLQATKINSVGGTAYCQIYRNGVAVGVLHSLVVPPGTYTLDLAITEDISFNKGDLVQIYIKPMTPDNDEWGSQAVCSGGITINITKPPIVTNL